MNIGGKYNWKGQSERLIYLGRNWSGNGYWHQFAKVEEPERIWCEVLDSDLHMIEATKEPVCESALAGAIKYARGGNEPMQFKGYA